MKGNAGKVDDKASTLRAWQEAALGKFLHASGDFLAVATPGAGKTYFAITAATRLMKRGEIRRVIVVVPSAHLRRQWAEAAAALGLKLDCQITNKATEIASGMDGAVATFSMAAGAPLAWKQIAGQSATLVILDEIHHCGDKRTWGPAINVAFSAATRRLLLSGTPFRSDGTAIPFVRYRKDGLCDPDYEYDYGTALAAGGVVRPVQFHALDGDMTWRSAGRVIEGKLSAAGEKVVRAALTSAYDAEGAWIASVFEAADRELSRHRESVPDAGGLILAPDQKAAEKYVGILEAIAREKPVLVISSEPESSRRITEFAASSARWMVAVQMVSEGVDIPRLEVGVYASRVKTEMFFRQAVGRFVRVRGLEDKACATLFIPSVKVWLRYAQRIEHTVGQALRDKTNRPEWGPETEWQPTAVEAVESSGASLYATVHGGESFTDAELAHAAGVAKAAGLNVPAAQMAKALRLAVGNEPPGETVGEPGVSAQRRAIDQSIARHDMFDSLADIIGRNDLLTVDGNVPLSVLAKKLSRGFGGYPSLNTAGKLRRALCDQGVRTTRTGLDPSEMPYRIVITATGASTVTGIVSTGAQDHQLQRDALVDAGCGRIYIERDSGRAAAERPGLAAALEYVSRPGDVLVAWRLEGISREADEIAAIAEVLAASGTALKILAGEMAGSYSAVGGGMDFAALTAGIAEFDYARQAKKAG